MSSVTFNTAELSSILNETKELPNAEAALVVKDFFLEEFHRLKPDARPDEDLLSSEEAGKELGVEASTLAIWRCTGRYQLPFVKIGRLVKYRMGDIREFKQVRRVGA